MTLVTAFDPDPSSMTAPALGVECFAGDLATAATAVVARAKSGRGGYACLGNAHVLVTAHHDHDLSGALNNAWRVFPDGAPVAWLQRRLGHNNAERIGGPDLMPRVCRGGVALRLRHFLLGSTNEVLVQLQARLEGCHPGIEIVGSYSPSRPEIEADVQSLLSRVRVGDPQVVWCAFGAPRQELWMARAAPEMQSTLLVGVGAAFDFIAGSKPRANPRLQRVGLEWAHRLANEPTRLLGRYLRTNSEFMVRAGVQLLKTSS